MYQGSRSSSVSLRRTFRQVCSLQAPSLKMTIHSIGTPEVTQLVANISNIYVPQLVVGFTPVRLRFIIVQESS